MELPNQLKQEIDAALEGHAIAGIAHSASILSSRYRAEVRDGRYHLSDDRAALAYIAARLPATYAAVRAALAMTAQEIPDFTPATLLDVGAGPGTVLWAADDQWPGLQAALMVEGSPAIRRMGERLTAPLKCDVTWRAADILTDFPSSLPERHDLVTMSYVLDELAPEKRSGLIDLLWSLTAGVLVIVEPGTPAGYERIKAVRSQLITLGAYVLAPCPHGLECPLLSPDWCHFSRRVARSRIHRQAKGGDVPWEDEKYTFIAVMRPGAGQTLHRPKGRVLALPRKGPGRVQLKLCLAGGELREETFSRRDGNEYKSASRADWGDIIP